MHACICLESHKPTFPISDLRLLLVPLLHLTMFIILTNPNNSSSSCSSNNNNTVKYEATNPYLKKMISELEICTVMNRRHRRKSTRGCSETHFN